MESGDPAAEFAGQATGMQTSSTDASTRVPLVVAYPVVQTHPVKYSLPAALSEFAVHGVQSVLSVMPSP